ncbi:protein kinase [Anabaena sp. FACHB-1237]|uniref:protein kinase domain-containing protein n=1 Tax=Anabaena sp. FACHB-1237 TaxID=2692769 RepID=UPI00168086BC|nr:protein kinase [Anabaena sp. FACHB-1237]MBD2138220.1 protein kinase [Anabaena sp. FACHB-1237]
MITITLLETQLKTPPQQWRFSNSTVIRIGRAVDNDVVLADALVSRYHLELRLVNSDVNGEVWEVISKGTNGTFVNNNLLTKPTRLNHNSILQLAQGGPIIQLQLEKICSNNPVINNSNSSCSHEGNSPDNLFCVKCGQAIVVQKTIRYYQVLRTLGQGGMGTTYLAWDKVGVISGIPQLLVLKEMNADMINIPKAQELFEREAYTLKSLEHSGIPKYYDFFVEDGKKYLAMELVHGQDLEKRVFMQGPVTPEQAIAWMVQTCDILSYLHSQDPPLIHRDIKPANLMVKSANNRIVILDFGAVKETGTAPGTRIGAEGYCAPEQERGQPVTQSDLYAIGPTLIFLLTGQNPFKYYRQKGRVFKFDVRSIPTVTPGLRQVIECVTEPLPRDRYQSAQELSKALKSASI